MGTYDNESIQALGTERNIETPLRIGLTGGIGSGKTTVSDMFEELGVPVIDADIISRQITQKDGAAYGPIVGLFGKTIISDSGELKRDKLRELVFNNANLRKRLEAIIHPLVRAEIANQIRITSYPYCLISVPLLLETAKREDFDLILIIDCPEDLQLMRASHRDGVTIEEIKKIIASQTDRKTRLDNADDVIYNDRDLEWTRKQVSSLHERYQSLAQRHGK